MTRDLTPIDSLIAQSLDKTFPAAQVELRVRGTTVYARAFGFLDPETKTHRVNLATRFDLASVSKLFTVAAFMTYVEESRGGWISASATSCPNSLESDRLRRTPIPCTRANSSRSLHPAARAPTPTR